MPFSLVIWFFTALAVGIMMSRVKAGKEFLPIAFLIGIYLGFSAGSSQFEASFMEDGTVISLCISAVLLFSPEILTMYLAIPLFLLFGFFNGNSLGLSADEISYGELLIATAGIHLLGLYGITYSRKRSDEILSSFP